MKELNNKLSAFDNAFVENFVKSQEVVLAEVDALNEERLEEWKNEMLDGSSNMLSFLTEKTIEECKSVDYNIEEHEAKALIILSIKTTVERLGGNVKESITDTLKEVITKMENY